MRVVREVVHRWDPYALLAEGCPLDEFDSEIVAVVAQVPHIRSRIDAALALSRVFSSAFQLEGFQPDDCSEPGNELYEALTAAGLVATQRL
jgi:hypothetical protein